ncbi:MAG: DUF924 domain-containing protein [Betaproteobacteria bacterium]|nr:MAG: DUF924 domain-containing protein [Betaproteobacteria bacterium]
MNDHLPSGVLRFWFGAGEEYGRRHKRWFEKDPSFDAEVSRRFLPLYEKLAAGAGREWLESRADCLARIVVLDQFPRQLFRGSARAFATDALALEAARHAITRGYDRSMLPVERMFAYLPFEHSESLEDQLKACELTAPLAAFPQTADAPRYALRHRDVIQRFGRFPHRNVALGRPSTPEEIEFLKQPASHF